MAKLKIPFVFTCTVTSAKLIREQPKTVEKVAKALVESVHFFKGHKDQSIRIMAKYTRDVRPAVIEGSWNAYKDILEESTTSSVTGLTETLAVQSAWDPKAAKANAEDFVDRRFTNMSNATVLSINSTAGRALAEIDLVKSTRSEPS
jgi:ABC-type nitrate/sulfonate/bicarbonate transport system substrate-binding protein